MLQNVAISLGGLVFALAGLRRMYQGRAEWDAGERIADRETTAIRDIEPGPIEVKGSARPAEDATVHRSPFSETESLATRITVKEWHSDGRSDENWATVFEEETAERLLVDDGTGDVAVSLPDEGGLDLTWTETRVESDEDPPDAIRRYVENRSDIEIPDRHSVGALSVGERRRYLEGTLEPGEDVYVLGTARGADAGWDQRGYVIDEPTSDGDFVLSNKSEDALVKEGKQGGFVFLAFGGLLTLIGLGVLLYPWLLL